MAFSGAKYFAITAFEPNIPVAEAKTHYDFNLPKWPKAAKPTGMITTDFTGSH